MTSDLTQRPALLEARTTGPLSVPLPPVPVHYDGQSLSIRLGLQRERGQETNGAARRSWRGLAFAEELRQTTARRAARCAGSALGELSRVVGGSPGIGLQSPQRGSSLRTSGIYLVRPPDPPNGAAMALPLEAARSGGWGYAALRAGRPVCLAAERPPQGLRARGHLRAPRQRARPARLT